MSSRSQKPAVRSQHLEAGCLALLALLACAPPGRGADFTALCADRTAIERVYHSHRLNTSQAFEEVMPAPLIARLTRADLHKEGVLRTIYGVEITAAMVEAEVQRINATTRAPEVLAEIKAALGHDPARFARTLARPIVVERTLRARFENDDVLHGPQRRLAERARARVLAARDAATAALHLREIPGSQVVETTWVLTPRPPAGTPAAPAVAPTPTKVSARSGAYAIEATAQLAQVVNPPAADADKKTYFEDLDPELQKVLRVQLQRPGDVSAVIETPGGFLVFLAREVTPETLGVTSFSLPKRSYEEWLAQQPQDNT